MPQSCKRSGMSIDDNSRVHEYVHWKVHRRPVGPQDHGFFLIVTMGSQFVKVFLGLLPLKCAVQLEVPIIKFHVLHVLKIPKVSSIVCCCGYSVIAEVG